MSTAAVRGVVRQLGLADPSADPPADAALVTRYAQRKDEAAFAELLRRHGPVVLGACRRVLADPHDAEDAFQAVFLVLARKAGDIRPPGLVGSWLYGVAVRTANKARVAAARRWRREMAAARPEVAADPVVPAADLKAVLDDELGKLPDRLRAPVVLCDLGGRSRAEAARELGCPEGTVAARLHQARKVLARRLSRRGVTLPAAGLAAVLTPEAAAAAVPPALAQSALAAAGAFAPGVASPAVPPAVEALAEGVLRAMTAGKFKLVLVSVLAGGLLAGGALWGANRAPGPAPAAEAAPNPTAVPAVQPPVPTVNPVGYVTDVRFSPDGKRYAVVGAGVKVHDAATNRMLWATPAEAAGYSADGKTLLVMADKVREHDAETGKVQREHPRPKTNLGWHLVRFSPDGKRYAAHFGFTVRVYDTATGFEPVRLAEQFEPGGGALFGSVGKQLTWSPDGTKLAAVGVLVGEGKLGAAVWDAEAGARLRGVEAAGTGTGPRSAAFSPDGKALAVLHQHDVYIYSEGAAEPRRVALLGDHTAVAFMPDGRVMVGGEGRFSEGGEPLGDDSNYRRRLFLYIEDRQRAFGGISFLDMDAVRPPNALPMSALAISPDGRTAVTGTGILPVTPLPKDAPRAGEVKVWNLAERQPPPAAAATWREKYTLPDHNDLVDAVAFSPDGKLLASAGADGKVIVRDAATLQVVWTFSGDPAAVTAVDFSRDGRFLAVTRPGGAELLDVVTGKVATPLGEPGVAPAAVAFGAAEPVQGRQQYRLAFTDGKVLWAKQWVDGAAAGGATFGPLAGAPKLDGPAAAAVAYSPDGKRVVFALHYKVDPAQPIGRPDPAKATHWIAQVWGAGSGEAMAVLPHGTDPVTAVAWSPDGKHIATGGADGNVVLWDAATAKEARRVALGGRGGKSTIHALAFSPDGKTLAAAREFDEGKNPRRVGLIDTATGKVAEDLQFFTNGPPVAVAFSPDGRTLVVGCGSRDPNARKHPAAERAKLGEVRVFTAEPPR